MPFKKVSNKKFVGAHVNKDLWQDLTETASLLSLTVGEALEEALDTYVDIKMNDITAAIKSGSGVLGRFKKNPEAIRKALDG
jgi:hypothetical protein